MNIHSVYSKAHEGRLLHVIANAFDCGTSRADVSPPQEFLQVSILPLALGKVVSPHIHSPREAQSSGPAITQESWLVLRGAIRIRLFDLDRALLEERVLSPGNFLVTFHGGHSLECVEENTVMLEYKNGPYLGRDFHAFPNS